MRTILIAVIAAIAALGAASLTAGPTAGPTGTAYRDEILKYRAEREVELKADEGWLTVAGLFWLKPGANVAGKIGTFGSAARWNPVTRNWLSDELLIMAKGMPWVH